MEIPAVLLQPLKPRLCLWRPSKAKPINLILWCRLALSPRKYHHCFHPLLIGNMGMKKNLLKITSEAIIIRSNFPPFFKDRQLILRIDRRHSSHHTGYSRNLSQLSRSQSCRSLEPNKKAREIWNWMKTFWARIVIMRRKQESLKLECLSFITGPEAIQSCVISAVRHISNWRRYEDTAKKSMAFWLE